MDARKEVPSCTWAFFSGKSGDYTEVEQQVHTFQLALASPVALACIRSVSWAAIYCRHSRVACHHFWAFLRISSRLVL
ncbi:predicted protein [Plenodomus lingam JN3]|uniref:Predicted protein n=1 Tax=Leptosphaeria maculans (strain JN3 / isolate v23.1.3 / race Av1-4-5-6-7-8) TaxID=985895 RepID=E4ZIE0_LEPMJ|nr:predicted protein [Plenodomus lingam JN3]CBX90961.1 predicted protein [Plenodomus lingam JN3]